MYYVLYLNHDAGYSPSDYYSLNYSINAY